MERNRTEVAAGNTGVETTEGIGLQEISVAGLSGLAGMLAMIPVLALAWVLGALEPASFGDLASIVGLGESFVIGGLIFIGGGIVTFPLLLVSLAVFLPGRTLAQKGAVFGVVVWTGFLIAFYAEQTGLSMVLYLVLTLVAHAVYGGVLGAVYGRYANVPYYEV